MCVFVAQPRCRRVDLQVNHSQTLLLALPASTRASAAASNRGTTLWRLSISFLLLCSSCVAGSLGQSGTGSNNATNMGNSNDAMRAVPASTDHLPNVSACTSDAPPPRAIRRLTRVEFNNTLIDLFADPAAPQSDALFTSDATSYGFDNVQEMLSVRDNTALDLTNFAESVGAYATAHVATLSPTCQSADAACFAAFINSFGARAFRRPVSSSEQADLIALVSGKDANPDFGASIGILVAAMVQSPGFLYRTELGEPGGNAAVVQLTPYEVASELSYTYTATMPDAPLLAAAAAGALATPVQLEAQAKRLLAQPRAKAAVESFFAQWLQVARLNLSARSEGTDVLDSVTKQDMQAESRQFIDDVVFTTPGTVADLFLRDKTFLTPHLATFYGSTTSGSVTASSIGRIPGVLGQGGVLTAASQPTYASPTLRGRMLRMRMLCGSVPAPPPGTPPLGESNGQQTLRQRLVAHAASANCAACHDQMDPLGFTLGKFDTIGRARASGLENSLPVDTNGSVAANIGESGATTAVADGAGLAAYLAASTQAQDCLVRHWSMYALGHLSWAQDGCTFASAASNSRAQGSTLAAVLISLVHTPGFLQRSTAP